ncbi:MAG: GNAT family N-acetyltransferase [Planctomycetota bacterium]|nr:MAG: GNAT family N-acetyltransferase [Planctomycetota bacterium]
MRNRTAEAAQPEVTVRPLEERDLPAADRILRFAFGTFLGLPEPLSFMGDADYVRTRWLADPSAAFGAEIDGELVGSNFATSWGSTGFFGPLSIRPDFWDRGVGKRLMEPVLGCFERWGTKHAGLFTFAHSQKHVGLYQKFGFWPRFLTAVMTTAVGQPAPTPRWTRFSDLPESEREPMLRACREVTGAASAGLDVSREIRAVAQQGLGDTLLLRADAGRLAGLAVCHCGPGSEAGSGICYVKFGVVRPGPAAAADFDHLLDACGSMAAEGGLRRLVAGVNLARHEAYLRMLGRGFRTDLQGIAMQRPDEPGYNRAGVYLIDDWR